MRCVYLEYSGCRTCFVKASNREVIQVSNIFFNGLIFQSSFISSVLFLQHAREMDRLFSDKPTHLQEIA